MTNQKKNDKILYLETKGINDSKALNMLTDSQLETIYDRFKKVEDSNRLIKQIGLAILTLTFALFVNSYKKDSTSFKNLIYPSLLFLAFFVINKHAKRNQILAQNEVGFF